MKNLVRKELLFSGGTGASAYLLGFTEGLIKIVGKSKLLEYSYGGISAGFSNSFLLYCSLHSNLSMRQLYETTVRKLYFKENKYKCLTFVVKPSAVDLCLRQSYAFYKELNLPNPKGSVYTFVSEVGNRKLTPLIIDNFESEEMFVEGFKASVQLPFITVNSLYAKYEGKTVLKGSFTRPIPYKYEDSHKVFLNVRPERFIKNVKNIENLNVIDIMKPQHLQYPRDYWFWNEDWADSMYEKGFTCAYLLQNHIHKVII